MVLTWRDYLTDEEAAFIAASDDAKARWQETAARRAFIMNRAVQRKRHAEKASACKDSSVTALSPERKDQSNG